MLFYSFKTLLESLYQSIASKKIFHYSSVQGDWRSVDKIDTMHAVDGHSWFDGGPSALSQTIFDDMKGHYNGFFTYDRLWLKSDKVNLFLIALSHSMYNKLILVFNIISIIS